MVSCGFMSSFYEVHSFHFVFMWNIICTILFTFQLKELSCKSATTFGGEYHMYHIILLHSRDYFNKTSMKINVATDKGNSPNEIRH